MPTIRLQKGQRIDLRAAQEPINKLIIQAEWPIDPPGAQLDLSAFLLSTEERVRGSEDLCFYNLKPTRDQGLLFMGRGRTQTGMGTHLRATPARFPEDVAKVVFSISAHRSDSGRPAPLPKQCVFRLCNEATSEVLAEFQLPDPVDGLLLGNLYRHRDSWKFKLEDQPFKGGLPALFRRFGLSIPDPRPALAPPPRPKPTPKPAAPPATPPKTRPTAPAPKPPSGPAILQKGQKTALDLSGDAFLVELQWQAGKDRAGRAFLLKPGAFLLLADETVAGAEDFLHQGNPTHPSGALVCLPDVPGTPGKRFHVTPAQIPANISRIVFVIALDNGFQRKQSFAAVRGLCLQVRCETSDQIRVRFPLTGDHNDTAMVAGALYRHQGAWKFQALGTGFSGEVAALCRRYGLKTTRPPTPNTAYGRIDGGAEQVTFVAKKDIVSSRRAIEDHLSYFFSDSGRGRFEYRTPIHMDIYIVEPGPTRNYYTLLTHAGGREQHQNLLNELLLCLPPSWDMSPAGLKQKRYAWPFELLRRLSAKRLQERRTLVPGDLFPNGQPALPYASNTGLCGAMVYVPSLFMEFEDINLEDDREFQFYSLVPLFREELAFAEQKGSDALLERLDQAGVNEIINPKRAPVDLTDSPKKSSWLSFIRRS